MAASTVHHIGIGVVDEKPMLRLFLDQLGFQRLAYRETIVDTKWVLQKNNIIFVVSKFNIDFIDQDEQPASLPHFSNFWYQPRRSIPDSIPNLMNNSVYEICLEVCDVQSTLAKAQNQGAEVLKHKTVVSAEEGSVEYAVIRSCVGNTLHTIVNSKKYHGPFLPTFSRCSTNEHAGNDASHVGNLTIDHITLCVENGKTLDTMSWYENCLSASRLLINKNETKTEGLILSDIGMKMAALEYWRCAESGLTLGDGQRSVKLVIAESLVSTPNQVTTFITQHGGPGVQHIGLETENLIETVTFLKDKNVLFLQPPKQYYDEVSKLNEIVECGESVELLERCGILLDSEADTLINPEDLTNECRYLMQVFTKPIFGDETFFLEFLQRHGARGFGAGNISALWKAVKRYMEAKGYN